MFSTLIASGTTRAAAAERGAVPSVLLHVGVIAAMLVATRASDPFVEASGQTRVVPLFAPQIAAPQPTAPTRPQPAPTTPTPAPEIPVVPIDAPPVPTDLPTGIPIAAPAAPVVATGSVDPNAVPSADVGTPAGLPSGNPAFADAVRQVLPRLRFTPAHVGAQTVRQVVEIPFGFEMC